MRSVTAFAPATVSNVGCGYDVLGLAIDGPGDEVTATIDDERTGAAAPDLIEVTITDITGDDGRLSREAMRNTAGVAAQALLSALGERRVITLSIRKGLPLAGGLGGSAASAAAAVVAVDALVGAHAPRATLVACALEGERVGAGAAHPDNVVPAIYGGLVLVRQSWPLDVVELPAPPGLAVVAVHPHLEIETSAARALVGDTVRVGTAVQQSANLGALVHGLHRSDFALMARALVDSIAEPRRSALIPGLEATKRAAVAAGAVGAGLSGSGPSLFALCQDVATAGRVAVSMEAAVRAHVGVGCETYVSSIPQAGARVIG